MFRHAMIATLLVASTAMAQVAHPGIGVRVRAPGVLFERFTGVYLGRSGDTLLLGNDERGPVRVPAAAVSELDLSKGTSRWQGALRGALWGGGIFLAIGVVGALADTSTNTNRSSDIAYLVIGGAETGAIIGAIIGKRVWVRAQPAVLLNSSALDDNRRLALRVAIVR